MRDLRGQGLLSAGGLLLAATLPIHADIDFAGITTWVGAGANQSALVIDWNDSRGYANDYRIYGYNWDTVDAPSTEDMVRDVAAADPDLYLLFHDWGFGQTINGIGFDSDHDGFGLTPAVTFTSGVGTDPDPYSNEVVTDADDDWNAGWNGTDWWQFFTASGAAIDPDADWTSSNDGISDVALTDNSWQGLSYSAVAPPAAVPEPSTLALLLAGAAAVLLRRRAIHFSRS